MKPTFSRIQDDQPRLFIRVKTAFIALHRYRHAPVDVAFLRSYHRHVFHVEVVVAVDKANREIEFFTLQKKINKYLKEKYENKRLEYSCETMALDILKKFNFKKVEVSEDGENSGIAIS